MKKATFTLACLLGISAFSASLYAQTDNNTDNHTIGITVPEVALLDIEPSAAKNITMNFVAPTEAGLAITAPADNNTLWLNYSSIVTASGTDASRKISVKLDALIPNIDIKVTAAAPTGGAGSLGSAASGALPLTTTDQDIITAIGSCYTGDGVSNGTNLTYNVSMNASMSYENIVAQTNTATVTYTISDN